MNWETKTNAGTTPYQEIQGKHCYIVLTKRPAYCDRGNFVATIFNRADVPMQERIKLGLDWQDGWPRYFFDETRAKLEIEAWLLKRKQALP